MILPRIVSQLLVGRAPAERRRARPEPIRWQLHEDAQRRRREGQLAHPSEGQFEVGDQELGGIPPAVDIQLVDHEAARALAEEARALLEEANALSGPGDPSPPRDPH